MKPSTPRLDQRERGAVSVGLHLLRSLLDRTLPAMPTPMLYDMLTCGGEARPLTAGEIEALQARLRDGRRR